MRGEEGRVKGEGRLDEYLIYGSYPEIVVTEGRKEKIDLLEELSGSYLLTDVLA